MKYRRLFSCALDAHRGSHSVSHHTELMCACLRVAACTPTNCHKSMTKKIYSSVNLIKTKGERKHRTFPETNCKLDENSCSAATTTNRNKKSATAF